MVFMNEKIKDKIRFGQFLTSKNSGLYDNLSTKQRCKSFRTGKVSEYLYNFIDKGLKI